MPRFHIINFGCRANQSDGAVIERELACRGFENSSTHQSADIVLLNSCTVTASADYGVRQAARRIHRENPSARIWVTGCYAQRSPEELASLPGVECVAGNSHKSALADLIASGFPCSASSRFVSIDSLSGQAPKPGAVAGRILRSDIFAHTDFCTPALESAASSQDRTRPNLKIQDGCNNRCSFCVIPYVRGRSRSMSAQEVIRSVSSLCEHGYREVVLSGINLGRWGRDLKTPSPLRFAQLVRGILEQTPVERIRLSSVEPMDFTDELLDLMASSPRIAHHVHAPLQSGSDHILRRMHRKYRAVHYYDRIQAAFSRMPDAAFGADVMVGFPGESDEDFERTRSLIASLPFTYLHVFPFSRRPGTPADQMNGQVHGAVIRERARILRELAAEKNLAFRNRQIGQILDVITLDQAQDGRPVALSGNFLEVFLTGMPVPSNQWVHAKITGIHDGGVSGEQVAR